MASAYMVRQQRQNPLMPLGLEEVPSTSTVAATIKSNIATLTPLTSSGRWRKGKGLAMAMAAGAQVAAVSAS
jgi:hypothetical protein